jgi:hypothetical protein
MPTFYHTTESIDSELEELSRKCSFITLEEASTSPRIQEVSINRNAEKRFRGYLIFGEHPRELISPETGMHFLRDLCHNS